MLRLSQEEMKLFVCVFVVCRELPASMFHVLEGGGKISEGKRENPPIEDSSDEDDKRNPGNLYDKVRGGSKSWKTWVPLSRMIEVAITDTSVFV